MCRLILQEIDLQSLQILSLVLFNLHKHSAQTLLCPNFFIFGWIAI